MRLSRPLKRAMTRAPILALPCFAKEFILEIDACDTVIGVVLIQEDKPVAYMSQALAPRHIISCKGRGSPNWWDLTTLFSIEKGKENLVTDALSRRENTTSCHAISALVLDWVQGITSSYEGTTWIKEILTRLAVHSQEELGYTLKGGLLRYQGRVVIGEDE